MILRKGLTGLVSVMCIALSVQATAYANPLRGLTNTINGVNNAIRSFDSAINGTSHTINSLTETLGIDINSSSGSINEAGSTEQVLQIYEIWYGDMSPEEQETVSWLVMEHARNQSVTFDTIATSEWFLQKPIEEQSQVSATFFKLQSIIEATAQDRNRFLAFAFCVNAGNDNCAM
ncbi:MAG: hypothetical protein F6K47_04320 [Symploca sp. SIO2E6]|nr:hypothetical protein [Symploca sp. SIO2E6]